MQAAAGLGSSLLGLGNVVQLQLNAPLHVHADGPEIAYLGAPAAALSNKLSWDEYQRILDAMKAASEGNEEAHSFLFQRYHSDQMPPDLKRLMEELIDNG